ncbi:glycosyl hydrolases family 31-domain-containing protein [Terfezia claveryi]|nr:glycosyl hydrolases family 31-domain-containing protein [Terfezia claveryi]
MRPTWRVFVVTAVCAAVFLVATQATPFIGSIIYRKAPAIDVDKLCKGYVAKNVRRCEDGLTVDLELIGDGCGVYGRDIKTLKLEVQYQESEYPVATSESRLHVKITDATSARYEIPESVFPRPKAHGVSPYSSDLEFRLTESPFSFSVVRKSCGEVLFSTDSYSLVFQNQYIRVKSSLPAHANIYGLGEHTEPLRLPVEGNGTVRTLWSRDSFGIPRGTNLYGNHPVYFDHRKSGTHGVFLLNSNGMDVKLNTTTHPKTKKEISTIEYNILGGVLDFYFFSGPDPTAVAQQYARVVGLPAMMPYWGFGFHQCRYGYRDWIDVAEVVANYSIAKIPLETMWTDIDYMYNRWVFTLDPEHFPIDRVRQIVDLLHSRDQHYILMVDPAVAHQDYPTFNRGVHHDIWLKEADGSLHKGVVWPGVTVFPDWFHKNIQSFWTDEFQRFFNPKTGVDIDGVWIDMNEPASFCPYPCIDPEAAAIEQGMPPVRLTPRDPPRPIPGFPDTYPSNDAYMVKRAVTPAPIVPPSSVSAHASSSQVKTPLYHEKDEDLISPPYSIANAVENGLSDRTVHTDIVHANGLSEYDTHNLYGHMMSIITANAMSARRPGKRPFIITRSTFAGAGAHVGKWLGDNLSTWEQYRFQIAGMLNFAAIYQMPMVGSDVCGFGDSATEELCARWAMLGAFNPFYRNHNYDGGKSQEFFLWQSVTKAAKSAIGARYRLLDYLYTAFHQQHTDGTPVLNPMFFLYPKDANTYPIDLQFFYGQDILVTPVTHKGATSVTAYFPDDIFYDFFTHEKLVGRGASVTIADVDIMEIPVYIRGGAILPLRLAVDEDGEVAMTTTELRKRNFELILALGKHGKAEGKLYIDDGESVVQKKGDITEVEFSYQYGRLRVRGIVSKNPGREVNVRRVVVLGIGEVKSKEWSTLEVEVDAEVQKVTLCKEGGWTLSEGMEIELLEA